jgi:hypothetical protein
LADDRGTGQVNEDEDGDIPFPDRPLSRVVDMQVSLIKYDRCRGWLAVDELFNVLSLAGASFPALFPGFF